MLGGTSPAFEKKHQTKKKTKKQLILRAYTNVSEKLTKDNKTKVNRLLNIPNVKRVYYYYYHLNFTQIKYNIINVYFCYHYGPVR